MCRHSDATRPCPRTSRLGRAQILLYHTLDAQFRSSISSPMAPWRCERHTVICWISAAYLLPVHCDISETGSQVISAARCSIAVGWRRSSIRIQRSLVARESLWRRPRQWLVSHRAAWSVHKRSADHDRTSLGSNIVSYCRSFRSYANNEIGDQYGLADDGDTTFNVFVVVSLEVRRPWNRLCTRRVCGDGSHPARQLLSGLSLAVIILLVCVPKCLQSNSSKLIKFRITVLQTDRKKWSLLGIKVLTVIKLSWI